MKNNILLLGHGYIAEAFSSEMRNRGIGFSQNRVPCKDFASGYMLEMIRSEMPCLVICAAAFIPKDSVASCDSEPCKTMCGNVVFPGRLAQACRDAFVPMAHISTGCLWLDGLEHVEDDPPQREFSGHCGFYIGTKIMAEKIVRHVCPEHYIWRVRLPFDEFDSDRNYLSKLARMEEVWDHENTICHRRDFAKACLDLWELRAPFGTYHVMNPGSVKATAIVQGLIERSIRKTPARIVAGPQGGSRVSVKKLLAAGVTMRPVEDALAESLSNWKPAHV